MYVSCASVSYKHHYTSHTEESKRSVAERVATVRTWVQGRARESLSRLFRRRVSSLTRAPQTKTSIHAMILSQTFHTWVCLSVLTAWNLGNLATLVVAFSLMGRGHGGGDGTTWLRAAHIMVELPAVLARFEGLTSTSDSAALPIKHNMMYLYKQMYSASSVHCTSIFDHKKVLMQCVCRAAFK